MNISVPISAHDAAPGAHGDDHGHHEQSSERTVLGFWIYLMGDCLIFATLFATYAVLANNVAGGPTGRSLFDLPYVAGETVLLLVSSFTFGIAHIHINKGRRNAAAFWLAATFLVGAGFVAMELHEFANLLAEGATPSRSAFLSAYFTLVGTHGLHVTAGLVWLAVMIHQSFRFGLDDVVRRRLACLSLFWHFLDLVWICVFTFVYLREAI